MKRQIIRHRRPFAFFIYSRKLCKTSQRTFLQYLNLRISSPSQYLMNESLPISLSTQLFTSIYDERVGRIKTLPVKLHEVRLSRLHESLSTDEVFILNCIKFYCSFCGFAWRGIQDELASRIYIRAGILLFYIDVLMEYCIKSFYLRCDLFLEFIINFLQYMYENI